MRSYPIFPNPQEPWIDPAHLLNGSVFIRQNIARDEATADLSALTTQVMLTAALPLQYRDVVAKLWFRSGGTGAGTPTNYWFALYDPAGNLLRQSADQTTTPWGTNTTLGLALATTYEATAAGVYYAAIMVKATTPPTLVGKAVQHANVSTGLITGQKTLAQTSGSSLTTTAPATIATPTAVVNIPWTAATAS